jgi:ubiquinone/menaquinone biosynthesis C-methylase UbiE
MSFKWNEIWDAQGNILSTDQKIVSGYDQNDFNSKEISDQLCSLLDINNGDDVLEVGCAAGTLARHFHRACKYVGCDRSRSMVRKAIELNGFSAIPCEANELIFKDRSFDIVFAFGVFHYFPDHDYAQRALFEMQRVARKSVLVADVPRVTRDGKHLQYEESFFNGYTITPGWYKEERFNALLCL